MKGIGHKKDFFSSFFKESAENAISMANGYLKSKGFPADTAIDYDYDCWDERTDSGVLGCYEADSVFEDTILIALNKGSVISYCKDEMERNPFSAESAVLDEVVYTTVFHEMGHGICELINDYLQNTSEYDEVYTESQELFDSVLANEEDSVEKFAWDFYDNDYNGNPLDSIVESIFRPAAVTAADR